MPQADWNIVELAIRQYAKKRLMNESAIDPQTDPPIKDVANDIGLAVRTLYRWLEVGCCTARGKNYAAVKRLAVGSGIDLATLLP